LFGGAAWLLTRRVGPGHRVVLTRRVRVAIAGAVLLLGLVALVRVGNLGALVWHMKAFGFGPGLPRPWPAHMHLGTWLTATSGMLNACLMVRAHFEARRDVRAARDQPPCGHLVAAVLGRTPAAYHCWVATAGAPAFVAIDGPLYTGGPIWRIETVSPRGPARPAPAR